MLILTRKAGEAILIDGGIRIIVLGTDGSGIRIGIEAPASVGIVREEVLHRLTEEEVVRRLTEEEAPDPVGDGSQARQPSQEPPPNSAPEVGEGG